jgi:hypothetical protein
MICSQCNGEGYETIEEDGRYFQDACYHCGTTGEVDEETDFRDRLHRVASVLAYEQEREYRHWVNSDPDGDGYDLGAAENMMSTYDYFRARVWEREPEIMEKLLAMSQEDQQFLVAWNEYPWPLPPPSKIATIASLPLEPEVDVFTRFNQAVARDLQAATDVPEDDIPF